MESTLAARLGRYNQLCRGYDDIYRQAALEAGISFVPYYILVMLCSTDQPLTQSDIQKDSFYPKQTINSAAMRLQELGYLELHPQGRRKILALTDAGKAFCDLRVFPILTAEQESFMELTLQEQEQLLETTEKHIRLFRQRLAAKAEPSGDQ